MEDTRANQQVPLCCECEHFRQRVLLSDGNVPDTSYRPGQLVKSVPVPVDREEQCKHARSLHVDPTTVVYGPIKTSYYSAEQMRDHICGPLGKLFEAKEKHYDQDYAHMDACAKAGVSERGPSR